MRIAVIGAGIVGVTTAFELAHDGHEVTVYERRGAVAEEASFAHAGIVSEGYVIPWTASGSLSGLFRRLLGGDAPMSMRVNTGFSPTALAWLWKRWRVRHRMSSPAHCARLQQFALYSKHRLNNISRDLRLDYERTQGLLVLLRTPSDLAAVRPGLAMLRDLGVTFEVFDARQCHTIEPGLSPETPLHAGICLPGDEAGNCRQFAHLIRTEAQQRGVRFRFHTEVQQIIPGKQPQVVSLYVAPDEQAQRVPDAEGSPREASTTAPVPLEPSTERFDAVVVCSAIDSGALLAPHGLKLPLAAVCGYSVTAPMRHQDNHPDSGPRSALMDERHKVAISRMGTRVRVSGGTELGSARDVHNATTLDTLYRVLNDWFPGVAQMSRAQRWKGVRSVLPDGAPVLGKSGIDGVWLNLGHGAHGWALACGSARVVADLMAERAPSIDMEGLGIDRVVR